MFRASPFTMMVAWISSQGVGVVIGILTGGQGVRVVISS